MEEEAEREATVRKRFKTRFSFFAAHINHLRQVWNWLYLEEDGELLEGTEPSSSTARGVEAPD